MSGIASFGTDLGRTFGSIFGIDFGFLLTGKGSHKPLAYDTARIPSLMIYADLIKYSFVGNTKPLMFRCYSFILKPYAGNNINSGKLLNYQTLSNLQLRQSLENIF